MKVIILGGPKDGDEMDIPSGVKHRYVELPDSAVTTVASPCSPERAAYNVRRKVHVSGKSYLVLVEPRLDKWLMKNFTQAGKEGDFDT
jgi:hypothetical protein